MHIETVGYVSIHETSQEKIHELISKHQLSDMDSHETEIITDVEPNFIEDLRKSGILSDYEASKLLDKCDLVKFYT